MTKPKKCRKASVDALKAMKPVVDRAAAVKRLPLGLMETLSEKQIAYIENRAAGMKRYDAAIEAGYSESTAICAVTHIETPKVAMALLQANKIAMKELGLSRARVLEGFLDAVEAAATSTELTNAWREIGKMIGAYEPERVQMQFGDLDIDRMKEMSIEELAGLAQMREVIEGEAVDVDPRRIPLDTER